MSKKIYVGNLNYATTEQSIRELFATFGFVREATIVMDRNTGATKGFGFVEMGTEAEAAAAIAKLDGAEFEGRRLRVNAAQERSERPASQ